MTFLEKLRLLMDQRRWSSLDLERRGKDSPHRMVSNKTVDRWLEGVSEPDISNVKAIAWAFSVPAQYLIDDSIERPEDVTSAPRPVELTPDERRYVEKGRLLGFELAADIMTFVVGLGYEEAVARLLARHETASLKATDGLPKEGPGGGDGHGNVGHLGGNSKKERANS